MQLNACGRDYRHHHSILSQFIFKGSMNTMYLFNIQLHAAVQVNVLLEAHYAGTVMPALEIYGRLGNKT